MQQFYKGRTTNHLSWVMVDATDFATPESALSAATKIKIYGKLRANDTVQFVSSGTGSLTNDIKHVGASALGIYTIGLVKADLSDASAAWYDQYIISLSATGAAYQTLVVDGGIDASAISGYQSRLSDILSQVVLATSAASDAASAAAQANSRVLLVQSRLSDLDSRLASDTSDIYSLLSDIQSDFQSRVPKRVATDSQLSDLHSDLKSHAAVMSGVQSDIYSLLSDLHSDLGVVSGVISDVYSNLAAGVAVGASDMSDLRSAIAATELDASDLSDIASAVWATARAEPTTVVSPTGTMKTGMEWLVALSRNKVTQTATVQSLRNDADTADIASAAVSDDGTTFTRGEFA